MRRFESGLILLILGFVFLSQGIDTSWPGIKALEPLSAGFPDAMPILHKVRQLPSDLEVGGDLTGLTPGSKRYLARKQLLALPQVTYSVNDDANFTGPTKISGVDLEQLIHILAPAHGSTMVVAICDDKYQAYYPQDYLKVHRPLLVLNVNGQPPSGWPKDSQDHKYDMGPYMISHSKFVPSFKILSHEDSPQIPWGVIRLDFRDEKKVFESISPSGPPAKKADVQAGFRIAQQNCFRCHNMGSEGGHKSGRSWEQLSALAVNSPEKFASYVHNPMETATHAQMPGNPTYDDATLGALTAYFRTFRARYKQ